MKDALLSFIMNKNFPCVMAKAVAAKGMLVVHEVSDLNEQKNVLDVLNKFYKFIDDYRANPDRLSSFILCLKEESDFAQFEEHFWNFIKTLNAEDKKNYCHDSRVSSDPKNENFSYSIKEEAFFILALHPESPRFSRRFRTAAIVFNPHQQFEKLRKEGIFARIRNIIRKRDFILQGSVNPMLNDFGDKSEIYQYMGRVYPEDAQLSIST